MEHADWFKDNHRIFLPSGWGLNVFGAWGVKEKSFESEHMNPFSKLLVNNVGDDLVFPVGIALANSMNGNPPGETWKWEWPKWPEFLTFEPAESIIKFVKQFRNILSNSHKKDIGRDIIRPDGITLCLSMNGKPFPSDLNEWEWPKWPEFLTFEPAESIIKFVKQFRNILSNSHKKDIGRDIIRPDGITLCLSMNGKPFPSDLNEDKSGYLISELEPGE
jgi:hypothetical protein